MKLMSQLILLSAGVLAAGAVAAASADGKSMAKRDARTQKVADTSRLLQQPRTMDEAAATKVRLANGAEGYLVPTELWNELAVQKTAGGQPRVVETDANSPAPAAEAATHD
jgi:hypothetical protein